MQYRTKSLLLYLTAGLFALVGCSKPSELGLSLVELNPSEIYTTDSLSIQMTSVVTAPLPADDRSRWLCGSYLDPIFGRTSVGIYTNFRLTSTNVTFPNATFDSLVLSLAYDSLGHYGGNLNNLGVQNWEVFRLNESIEPGTEYRSDASFVLGDLLASSSFRPAIYEDVEVLGTIEGPQLRIRLADALGQELMNPDSAIYENNSVFKSFFQGLYIRPVNNSENSVVLRFLPEAPETKLTLYYTDSTGIARDYAFLTDNDAESVLSIQHNFDGTRVLDNNPEDTIVYMQGMNGPSVKVEIPYLDNLGDNIVINKAELLVYSVDEDDRNYPIPDQLFCVEQSAEGSYRLVDDLITSISRNSQDPFIQFGGLLLYDGNIPYFRFNLSEFLQRIVNGEVNDKAFYIQPASLTDTERMLLGNNNSETLKAKLYLTYTKIN